MREKDQETQVDIIAEMRMGNPVGLCAYRIGLPDKEEVYESGAKRRITMIKAVTVQELADRLEAAAKREKAQHGNAAALREAIIKALTLIQVCDWPPGVSLDGVAEVVREIDSALDKPPRQCDVGTAEEQEERFKHFCASNYSACDVDMECCRCPLESEKASCEFAWAQMPYTAEKGEADGV